jgi:hypothetical protein
VAERVESTLKKASALKPSEAKSSLNFGNHPVLGRFGNGVVPISLLDWNS